MTQKILFTFILVCLLLSPFAFSFATDLYLTSTDGQNMLGSYYERQGANYRKISDFIFPTEISGAISASPKSASEIFLFHPYRINPNVLGLRRELIRFDESSNQFSKGPARNFPAVRPTQDFILDSWKNGNNRGLIYERGEDLVGKRINVPGNLVGPVILLHNNPPGTFLVTACVDPEGSYFYTVNFMMNTGFSGTFRGLNNGRPTGAPVNYQLSGAMISVDCSARQPNGRIYIAFKEFFRQGTQDRTRPFIIHFSSTYGILGPGRAVAPFGNTTQEIALLEAINTIKFVENEDGLVTGIISGRRFNGILTPSHRKVNASGIPFGGNQRLYTYDEHTYGYRLLSGLGSEHD